IMRRTAAVAAWCSRAACSSRRQSASRWRSRARSPPLPWGRAVDSGLAVTFRFPLAAALLFTRRLRVAIKDQGQEHGSTRKNTDEIEGQTALSGPPGGLRAPHLLVEGREIHAVDFATFVTGPPVR